jgi:hypothetical protein
VFLLKYLKNKTILSITARIIPLRNKDAFLTGMLPANPFSKVSPFRAEKSHFF